MGKISRFKSGFLAVILMLSVFMASSLVSYTPVFAGNKFDQELCGSEIDEDVKRAAGCETGNTLTKKVDNIIGVVIGVIAFLAVMVIVFAGQRYIVAQGDPGKIKQAREMILYAVISLVVALLAWAIVSFVSGAITSDANTGTNSGSSTDSSFSIDANTGA